MSDTNAALPGQEVTAPTDQGGPERRKALRKASERFREQHKSRVEEVQKELKNNATGGAEMLDKLAATEAALLEELVELEQQLVRRAVLLVDSPARVAQITEPLKALTGTHKNVAERVAALLSAAASLRATSRAGGRHHLRSVA